MVIQFIIVLCIVLSQFAQGMDLETIHKHDLGTPSYSGQKYRQRLQEGRLAKEELLTDIQTTLQAVENLHTTLSSVVKNRCGKLALLTSFRSELATIQTLFCSPEDLFMSVPKSVDRNIAKATSGNLLECYKEYTETFKDNCLQSYALAHKRLTEFYVKWSDLVAIAENLQMVASQSLLFEEELQEIVSQIKHSHSTPVNGKNIYQWIKLCFGFQEDLKGALNTLKSEKLLETEWELIQQLIWFFEERGKVLWEVAKVNVAEIPSDFNRLSRLYLGDNPAQVFFCTEDTINLKNISNDLIDRLERTFSRPNSWPQTIEKLKGKLRALNNVKFVIPSISKLIIYYESFKGKFDREKENPISILSPWVSGDIDRQPLRFAQPMAQRVFVIGQNNQTNTQDGLRIRKSKFNGVLKVNASYWLARLFNLPSETMCIGTFDDLPPSKQVSQSTQTFEHNFFMIQREAEHVSLAEFLREVSLGNASFEQLNPHSVGIFILYTLLLDSIGLPIQLGLVRNENEFDIKIIQGESLGGKPSRKSNSEEISEEIEQETTNADAYILFYPWLNQQISDPVKSFFQSNDITFILFYWTQILCTLPDGCHDKLIKKKNTFIENLIPLLSQNFQVLLSSLGSYNITYESILKDFQPRTAQICQKRVDIAQTQFKHDISEFFFDIYMDNVLKELFKLAKGAQALGIEFPYSKEDLTRFSEERLSIIKKMKEKRKKCLEWLDSIESIKVRDFFKKQHENATKKGVYKAKLLLKAATTPLLKKSNSSKGNESPIKSRNHSPLKSRNQSPLRSRNQSPLQRMAMGDVRMELLKCSDVTSRTPADAIEVFSLFLGLDVSKNDGLFGREFHSSWEYWIDRSKTDFMALPHHVQTFFMKRLCYDLQWNKTELLKIPQMILRKSQMNQWDRYQETISKLNNSPQPNLQLAMESAIKLFDRLWQGSLASHSSAGFFKALSDLLLMRHIGFSSCKESHTGPFSLRINSVDHYVLCVPESFVEFFGEPYCIPYDVRIEVLSHHLTLFYLSWLNCLNTLNPSLSFHPWFPILLQKSRTLQSLLWANFHQTPDQLLEQLWPEIFCKIQQFSENRKADKNAVLKKIKQGDLALAPLENQGTDFYWVPLGHTENIESILQGWDAKRDDFKAKPPLSLKGVATEVLNVFDDDPVFDSPDRLSDLDRQILKLASDIPIDVLRITHDKWKDPNILRALLNTMESDQVVQLAVALQLGCDIEHIHLAEQSLRIPGLRKEQHGALSGIIEAFSKTLRIRSLDLSENGFTTLDPELINSLVNFPGLETLVLSRNPICDPKPLVKLSNNPSLQAVVLEETFLPQCNAFVLSFLKSLFRKRVVWKAAQPTDIQHLCLQPQNRLLIFQSLFHQLITYAHTTERTVDFTNSVRQNFVASLLEVIAECFWEEALTTQDSFIKHLSIDKLFQDLRECNASRTNSHKEEQTIDIITTAGIGSDILINDYPKRNSMFSSSEAEGVEGNVMVSSQERLKFEHAEKIQNSDENEIKEEVHVDVTKFLPNSPVKEIAFKLLFALKYGCCFPGVAGKLEFALDESNKQIITDDPYCLVSLEISGNIPNMSFKFLTPFCGTYVFRNLGPNPDDLSSSPKKDHVVHVYSKKQNQTNPEVYCDTRGGEFPVTVSNLKHFMKKKDAEAFIKRLQVHITQRSIINCQDSQCLTYALIQRKFILPGLQKLNLSGTNVSSICEFPVMESLLALDLSNNNICDLEGFYLAQGNNNDVYKFPNLRLLDLHNNKITLAQEVYQRDFQRHFMSLTYLDLSHNCLTFIPTRGQHQRWHKQNPNQYINISHNYIPFTELYNYFFQYFSLSFVKSDPLESWSQLQPHCYSMGLFWKEIGRSHYVLNGRFFSNETAEHCVTLPEGSDQHETYGLRQLFLQSIEHINTDNNYVITTSEKEGIIKYIYDTSPAYLNTEFFTLLPQSEQK